MRARTNLTDLDRSVDEQLGNDVPQVLRRRGKLGLLLGSPTDVSPLARRAAGQASNEGRDVVAERDRIRAAMQRAHQRRARRRPLLTWLA
jgi:hypothetical protein